MRNFSSSMHGNIDSAQNRSEKRAEHERELGHEKPIAKPKMSGLLYHADGKKKDKKGNAYSPHYGTKDQGQRAASVVKGRYVHLGEEAVEVSFEDMVEEACWKGYKQVGMKKKGAKQVPNCVPESDEINEGLASKIAGAIMGAAPSKPKYKVGQTVTYDAGHQKAWESGGRGKGKIHSYENGHYMIDGKYPVNHHEIKKVHESDELDENHIPIGSEIDTDKGKMKVTKQKGKDGYEVKELDESIVHSQEDVTGTKFHVKKLSSGTYDLHKQAKTGEWEKLSSHKSLESAKQMIK